MNLEMSNEQVSFLHPSGGASLIHGSYHPCVPPLPAPPILGEVVSHPFVFDFLLNNACRPSP